MANIIGEPLEGYVINQINARQKLHGSGVGNSLDKARTPDQLALLNSNTSWIKLASGVSVSSDRLKQIGITDPVYQGIGLAKEYILFGGTSHLTPDKLTQRTGFLPQNPGNPDNYSTYNPSRQGYVPMPGITNAEIKTLNRGSLKKANVRFKVHSKEQFEIIDLLYLRLGYTVLLEWGNSIFTTDGTNKEVVRNTLLEKIFFNLEGSTSYLDTLSDIEGTRIKYGGNYDGLLGKISNFDWSYQPDGSYDINLTIISLGDVIESLKLNLSTDRNSTEFIQTVNQFTPPEDPNSPPVTPNTIEGNKDSNLISFMLWAWKYSNRNNIEPNFGEINIITGKGPKGCGSFLERDTSSLVFSSSEYRFILKTVDASYDTTEKIKNNGWIRYDSKAVSQGSGERTFYTVYTYYYKDKTFSADEINDGKIFDYKRDIKNAYPEYEISQDIKHYKKTGTSLTTSIPNPNSYASKKDAIVINNKIPQYYVRFGYLLSFIKEKIIPVIPNPASNLPVIDIDDDTYSNKMYFLPNQISLDPTICLVRNKSFLKKGAKAEVFPQLSPYVVQEFDSNGNPNSAYVMNIYLNFDFVQSSLDSNLDDRGDVNIYGFLSSICTGLNKALGGINNLEPVIDEETNTLKIIDSTPIPGLARDKSNEYTLQLYGYDHSNVKNLTNGINYTSNFIRNIDLKTAITPEYATMITVGATAGGYVKGTEATAFSKWNIGLTDRFKETILPGNSNSIPTSGSADEAEINYVDKFLSKFGECYGYKGDFIGGGTPGTELSSDIISSNLSVVTEYYKYLQTKNKEGGGIVGFIPFKLGLTMDGISGIKIYNKLHVETKFLPSNYDKAMDLIITGVTHKLQSNDWETQIEATVIPKTGEISSLNIDYATIEETLEKSSCPPITFTVNDPSSSKTQEEVATLAKQIFTELSNQALAGMLGHLNFESGGTSKTFNPTAFNSGGGGCGALGIAQWRSNRQKNLFEYASTNSLTVNDIETQLKFLKHELKTSYPKVWKVLTSSKYKIGSTNITLNIVHYASTVNISTGLGSYNPDDYLNNTGTLKGWENENKERGGMFDKVKYRYQHAYEILDILKSL